MAFKKKGEEKTTTWTSARGHSPCGRPLWHAVLQEALM